MPVIQQTTLRLKWLARLSGWLFWSLVASWVLVVSLWMSLHLFIVPRIDEFRPWLQQQGAQALGVRLELGAIRATSSGWVPAFEVSDVRILDASGQTQLSLGRVTLALTPASALQGAFSQITLDRLNLELVRDAQGVLHVAGMPLHSGDDAVWRHWVFSQWEWVLRDGELSYLDQAQGLPATHFTQLEGVWRNGLRDHRFRLDATPAPELGQRLSVRGDFKQPLFSSQAGRWENWSGQAYVQSHDVNLHALQQRFFPTLSPRVQGSGWARVWLQIQAGQLLSWTSDVGLTGVRISAQSSQVWRGLPAFKEAFARLEWVAGPTSRGALQNARLQPEQGPAWPTRQATIEWQRAPTGEILAGQAQVDALNLAQLDAWMALAPTQWADLWHQAAPQGLLKQLQWRWTGPLDQMQVQSWKTQAIDVAWQPAHTTKAQALARWPGVSGLSAELSGTGQDMKGQVSVREGHLLWPGLWEEPKQNIDRFQADVLVQSDPQQTRMQWSHAQLESGPTHIDFNADWRDHPQDPLGRLELQATVARVQAQQIARWLPLSLPDPVRQYVKTAIPQGQANAVVAKVAGPLSDFPFSRPGSGEFRISGQLSDVRFVTVPKHLMDADTRGEWPAFQNLSGTLVFDRASVKLSKVKARLTQAPNMAWSQLEADIADLDRAVVSIRAEGKGPLNDALNFWRRSPLHDWTDRALDTAKAQGLAEYRLNLSIPIEKAEDTQAQGTVVLAGNELSMARGSPTMNRVRGTLRFTANSFELQGVQASMWGGDVKLEGGAKVVNANSPPVVQIKAQGQLSANGLREAPELSDWAALLKNLQGSTAYTAQLQWRRGQLESQVQSNLQGLAIQAPQGLGKLASETLPLRWETSLTPESLSSSKVLQDRVGLRWGTMLEARYVRDLSGAQPKVLRGVIRWGQKTSPALPDLGVVLRVSADAFNVDEWTDWMQPFTASAPVAESAGAWDWAPQRLELQAPVVLAQGRRLNQVQLDARKAGDAWNAKISATEMEGDLRFQPGSGKQPGQVMARLSRLSVPAQATSDVDRLLEQSAPDFPTLDVQVQNLDLHGKKLGALELAAQSLVPSDGSKEWRMSKLSLRNEDADFQAQGRWQKPLNAARTATDFDFKLAVKNAGGLLQRMGTPDAVRNGAGSIEGRISWNGSPVSPDPLSMSGRLKVDIERGQFLKSEPGAARLLGVLSLQSLPRRLMLDFRDVFSEGFAFDFFRGDVTIERGLAKSDNLQMKGVNAAVMMEGLADIGNETQQLKVLVIPDLNAGGASLVYSAINPVIGLTTFLAQYVLRRPLMESTTQQFEIDGTWSDPKVTRVPFKGDAKP